jgi:hypothetical protein
MEYDQHPRLKVLRDEEIPPEYRRYIGKERAEEVHRTYANFPPVLVWMSEMYGAVASANPIGPRLKEMLRLRVASLNDCRL